MSIRVHLFLNEFSWLLRNCSCSSDSAFRHGRGIGKLGWYCDGNVHRDKRRSSDADRVGLKRCTDNSRLSRYNDCWHKQTSQSPYYRSGNSPSCGRVYLYGQQRCWRNELLRTLGGQRYTFIPIETLNSFFNPSISNDSFKSYQMIPKAWKLQIN